MQQLVLVLVVGGVLLDAVAFLAFATVNVVRNVPDTRYDRVYRITMATTIFGGLMVVVGIAIAMASIIVNGF